MTAKYRFFQCFGVVSVLCGCLVAAILLRILMIGHFDTAWPVLRFALMGALSAYLFYIGLRLFRYGDSREKPVPRFRWGRILWGAWLVFINAENYFYPAPNLLKPSNATEAASMNVMTIVMSLVGLYLIAWGISQRSKPAISREESH
jgi:hypothetical protein